MEGDDFAFKRKSARPDGELACVSPLIKNGSDKKCS